MDQNLRKYFLISFSFHLSVMFFLWLNPSFEMPDNKPYKVTWLKLSKGDGGTNIESNFKNSKNLPQSTIREQKQALKDMTWDQKGSDLKSHKSETQKTVKQKVSQKKTSDTGGINLEKKPVTKKQSDAMSNALARIDQQLQQREVDMSAAQAKEGDTGQSQFGSDKGSAADAALVMYFNAIKRKINSQWVIAEKDTTSSLQTQILVMIDSRGNILGTSFKQVSGNGSFDDSALRAIKRAAPFPIPPVSIKSEALNEGFLIEFNPNKVTGRI